MESKASQLRKLMAQGEWHKAIRMAAKFPDLGNERCFILDANLAITNPRWCLGLNQDIPKMIDCGIAALNRRYGA